MSTTQLLRQLPLRSVINESLSGQIDFSNVCRGFCLLFVAKSAIRAKLFFNIFDTDGSGTISKDEFQVFLKCVNAIDESNYTDEQIKVSLHDTPNKPLFKRTK